MADPKSAHREAVFGGSDGPIRQAIPVIYLWALCFGGWTSDRANPVGFRGRIAVAFGSANRFEWEAAVACAATAGSEHGHVPGMFGTAGSPRAEERHPRIAGACELAG